MVIKKWPFSEQRKIKYYTDMMIQKLTVKADLSLKTILISKENTDFLLVHCLESLIKRFVIVAKATIFRRMHCNLKD